MSVQLLPLRAAQLPFGEPQSGLQTVPDCSPCSSPQQWDEIIIPTLWNLELRLAGVSLDSLSGGQGIFGYNWLESSL